MNFLRINWFWGWHRYGSRTEWWCGWDLHFQSENVVSISICCDTSSCPVILCCATMAFCTVAYKTSSRRHLTWAHPCLCWFSTSSPTGRCWNNIACMLTIAYCGHTFNRCARSSVCHRFAPLSSPNAVPSCPSLLTHLFWAKHKIFMRVHQIIWKVMGASLTLVSTWRCKWWWYWWMLMVLPLHYEHHHFSDSLQGVSS